MKKLYILLAIIFSLPLGEGWGGALNAQCTTLLNFAGATNGSYPGGSLISEGTFLYGMTSEGGINNLGTIFKIMPDGTGYLKLLDFEGASNGSSPYGSLISDGTFLYGMTFAGGTSSIGTIFKILPDGSGYIKLLDFAGATNGNYPNGSLISDGTLLYGMTYQGGTNSLGTIFKIMPDGSGYVKLLDFAGATNGSSPRGSLISDGTFLYGLTYQGGTNSAGTIFKIMPDGSGYVKLLDFAGATNGSYPTSSLISDGTFLYGTTPYGGINGYGTLFKIMPDGSSYVKLLDFDATNGREPYGSLISDGTFLYGMTNIGGINNFGTIFKLMPDGSGYVKLLDFAGTTNGNYPVSSLISDGTFLYGMTRAGGTNDLGVVFKTCIIPPSVSYVELTDSVCSSYGAFTLSAGTPIGGTYSGLGVTGNSFNPSSAGIGIHNIIYSFTDTTSGCCNTSTSEITVLACAGIEGSSLNAILVFPNPTTGIINIIVPIANSDDMQLISVTNMLGEVVLSKEICFDKFNMTIDISNQPAGIYFFRLGNFTKSEGFRILKL